MADAKKPGAAERLVDETMTDLNVGMLALRQISRGFAEALPDRLRWRLIGRPLGALVSTALTLAIPLMAINGEIAQRLFPAPYADLWTAGRQPNIAILAADGTVLGSRGSDLGKPVSIDTLPPYVVDAFLATEDRRFFEHPGFDPGSLVRATLINWTAGTVVQGGSTITQQLVKNLFLTGEQTIARKFEELQLALWLEARLSKEEILELYLNRIYLGANTYGLGAASQAYFSKDPSQLTLSEAALLAGLPKAPSSLAPHVNWDGALERSHEVIGNMVETGQIDRVTARVAVMSPPVLALRDVRDGYGYFLDHVAAELRARIPDLDTDVVVTTTLQPDAQRSAEVAVKTVIETETAQIRGAEQAALIAYDRSGGIVAMVGGRSYRESQFNRTTQAKRQPGSAFKPFVYLAAIEAGFDQDTVLVDAPIQVDGWEPKNYRGRFLGPIRLREALARSSNTATVQISETIGGERIIDAALQAGLNANMEAYPTLPLGVFEVALDELTAAYTPFAYGGYAPEPHAIARVDSRGGTVLYERSIPDPPRVISARSSEKMTDLLHAVTNAGTGSAARIPGHDVAGKTGTTDDWRDAWFVGYSAHVTAGVWVGNDNNDPMDKVSGATYPAQIWSSFMAATHERQGWSRIPLTDGFGPVDPGLNDLRSTYARLVNDLTPRAYGTPPQLDAPGYDGIGGILRREERRRGRGDRVQGRVVRPSANGRPGAPPPRGVVPGSGDVVEGRVVSDEPDSDGTQ
ncbi:MAG: PBP1A family penicillin-binding protein [Pseudomonadota bacterium]